MTDTAKILPKLRFPEFENDGEWEMQALGNCLLQAPDYGLNAPAVPYSPSLPTYLRITDIDDNGRFITDKKMSVDAEITEKNSLKAGDIVFARTGASVGKVYKYRVEDGSLIFAGFLIRVRPDNSKYCSDYIFQYLFTEAYKRWINITSSRSGQPGINSNEYASLPIPFPSLPEQQKIAAFLTSLDEQISAHTKKLEALKAHKKGLMQQLFPANGEKTPKLRFPEFENNGEWKIQTLGNCLLQAPDYGLNAPAVPYSPVLPTYLRITDIDDNGCFISNKKTSVDAEITDKNLLKAGDIVFARTGASVGKVYKYRAEDGALIFAGFLIRVRPDNSKYCSDYIFQYLFTEEYKRWINITSSRSGQPGINSNEYASLPIPFPSLPEQQKIASFLSSIDDMIQAQDDKIRNLKIYKNGLMQQIFIKTQ